VVKIIVSVTCLSLLPAYSTYLCLSLPKKPRIRFGEFHVTIKKQIINR